MNPKMVILLGFSALVVLTLALLAVRDLSDSTAGPDEALVPGLRDHVNDITAIDVTGRDGNTLVTLRRERERWRVREQSSFEADFGLVHDLLRDLAMAQRNDERTSNRQWYPRLGLADPGQEGGAIRIDFPESDLPAVLVGVEDSAGIGRFMRLADESRSWLVDRAPRFPETSLEWLERSVMDIPASQLAEITIRHPDGDTVRLRPAGEDDPQWVLLDVPEGHEAAPAWQLRPLASALAGLNLQNVREHDALPEDAISALYRTRDGLNFNARLFEDEDGYWLHFSVTAERGALDRADEEDSDDTRLLIDAAAVDGRLSPWQFAISESRFERMTRRQADLLVTVED